MVYAQDAEMLSSDSEELSNDSEVLSSDSETRSGDSEALEKPIVDEVEDLKQEVINLNRDLFILEEDLLFPATTQFVVFLSVDVGEFLDLDSVELKVDGETVTTYLYTEKQIKALHKGGIQRLYTGNIRSGEHELTAFLTGTGPNERNYKLGTTKTFTKGSDITSLELRVMDSTKNYQPEFTVVEWE
ncbi:AraC family transcriptional regulator [Hahella sp. CCB-MM4]|nr:AraC family transcriptional regulator [Hahella sp. CCB-MM4]